MHPVCGCTTRVVPDVCSGAYVPGPVDSGFSMIVGTPCGAGSAARRRAGAACDRSAATGRQAYLFPGGIVGSGCIRSGRKLRGSVRTSLAARCCKVRRRGRNRGAAGAGGRDFSSARHRLRAVPGRWSPGCAFAEGRWRARMCPRPYISRSSSSDFGAGSIAFSLADPRPGPRACPRPRSMPRPLPPESRPLRWPPTPGSGRLPSRLRPVM